MQSNTVTVRLPIWGSGSPQVARLLTGQESKRKKEDVKLFSLSAGNLIAIVC